MYAPSSDASVKDTSLGRASRRGVSDIELMSDTIDAENEKLFWVTDAQLKSLYDEVSFTRGKLVEEIKQGQKIPMDRRTLEVVSRQTEIQHRPRRT